MPPKRDRLGQHRVSSVFHAVIPTTMGMKLRAVDSSMLLAVGYDEEERELRVIFKTGDTYRYLNVPQEVYREWLEAESKGAYMKTHVVDVFASWRVKRS